MDEKEKIIESIKVSDILAKQLKIWQRVSGVLLGIILVFAIMFYIYVYNTETTIETTTLEGNQNAKIGTGNYTQLISSDLTNDNILKLMESLSNGKNTNYENNTN